MERHGDLDGDGYLEYRTRSPQGLVNQSWKDSWNSMLFADGRLATPPIATCEIQGYAYDARLRCARLGRTLMGVDPDGELLRVDPFLPHQLRGTGLTGVPFRGARVDT